jgi:hypothetical protein
MDAQLNDAGTAGAYAVHLQSLLDFAEELRHQLTALAATKETVEVLAEHDVRLGDFLEANLLLARHEEAVAQVRGLLAGVRTAVVFAEQVTDTVADSYQREDLETAALFGGVMRTA